MKNMDMQTAASAIRGMRSIVEEIDRLAAGIERLAVENGELRAVCEQLRERVERPENGAEPIKTDQRGIWLRRIKWQLKSRYQRMPKGARFRGTPR